MASLSLNAKQQFFDNSGNPAAGFKLYTTLTGTSTPQATYSDIGAVGSNPNPIILDSRGEAIIYLDPALVYRYRLTTAADAAVWMRDGVVGSDSSLRPDISGGTDALFTQAGTGAVSRALREKNRERVTAQDYGAVADGVADDTTALNRAVTFALSQGKKTVRLPAGRFRITSKLSASLPDLKGFSLEGEGMGITEILVDHAGGDGFEFTADPGNYWLDVDQHAAFRIANLTLVSNRVDAGTAIKINGGSESGRPPQAVVFDHVEFRGATSFQHGFSTCVDLLDCASSQFIGCRWIAGGPGYNTAIGVNIRASGAGKDPTEHKFTDCEWYFSEVAVQAGDYVEGVYFNNPTMVNCTKGIRYVTTSGESGLVVNGGHFNCFSRNIEVENVFDITISGPIMFHADTSTGFRHISLKNVGAFTVQGYDIRGASTDAGVYIESVAAGWGGSIGPGYFRGIGVGVYLDAGSQNVVVAPQAYTGVTTRWANFGTANTIIGASYYGAAQTTFTAGTASQDFTVAIPAGIFGGVPRWADIIGTSFNASFRYNPGGSTATLLSFTILTVDAGLIPNPTVYDFRFMAQE